MTCHNCLIDAPKNGKHRNGLQRFRCVQCGKTFTEPHEEAFRVEMYLDEPRGLLAVQMLTEGMSIRSTERITGLHRNVIIQLLVIAGQRCEALLASKIKSVPVTDVQCDEMWGFVAKKEANRDMRDKNFLTTGDAWCYIAIERNTKLVLAYHLGRRVESSTHQFMQKVADATDPNQRFQLSTDGLATYPLAIGRKLGDRVDYGQIIKAYAKKQGEEYRYSPPSVISVNTKPIYGNPGREFICTSHVERINLTTRMQVRRLTRLTNAFSKKWENLRAALALYFAWYNFCKPHSSIRATPAMKAGLTDRAWTLAELLGAA